MTAVPADPAIISISGANTVISFALLIGMASKPDIRKFLTHPAVIIIVVLGLLNGALKITL